MKEQGSLDGRSGRDDERAEVLLASTEDGVKVPGGAYLSESDTKCKADRTE